MRNRDPRKTVLVTGASSGIGLELAKALASSNEFFSIFTAREQSLKRLEEAGLSQSENICFRPLDVTSHRQRLDLIDEINNRWNGVDILVNNAGISYRAVVEHMTDEEEFHQMNTNYLGAMALIRLVLPKMRAKCGGKIINVSSVSGMMAMPTMSAYSASKFSLEGASESLWYELRPWNISVSLVQPGFIRSDSFRNVYYSKRSANCDIYSNDPYCQYYADMAPFVERLMRWSPTTATDVARKILKTIKRRRPPLRIPATLDAQIFFWLRRLIPRSLYHQLLYWSLPGVREWVNKSPCEDQSD